MDEQKIVAKIISGDPKALFLFYKKYSPVVFKFVQSKIGDAKDAEEIQQDTLLSGLESLRDFTFRSSLTTYLLSISRRKVADFYRKKRLKTFLLSKFPKVTKLVSTLFDPEVKLEEKLLKIRISRSLSQIKPNHQLLLRLKYIEGLSIAEICRKLNSKFKVIESQVFRARASFIKAYERTKDLSETDAKTAGNKPDFSSKIR